MVRRECRVNSQTITDFMNIVGAGGVGVSVSKRVPCANIPRKEVRSNRGNGVRGPRTHIVLGFLFKGITGPSCLPASSPIVFAIHNRQVDFSTPNITGYIRGVEPRRFQDFSALTALYQFASKSNRCRWWIESYSCLNLIV